MKDNNFILMESAPVHKAILKLSLPTVLSTIVSLIYNLTDTYFIGLLDDPVQLGAISLAFPVFMVVQAVGNIFGNGAPSYISRCLGAKNYNEARKTSSVSVYMAVSASALMTVLYFIFKNPILNILGTSDANLAPTSRYLNIIVGFSIVLTLQIILPAFLRAEGRVKEAVTGMLIGTILNIILDPVFILILNQGVAGAAWATIIGNCVAVIYYLTIYLRGKTTLSINPSDFKPNSRIIREVIKIGLPSSISQILMSVSNILLNNLASSYGDFVISAYGVAGKMIQIVFMLMLGYVSGYMPFAGYNYGANNINRLTSALKFTAVTATGACIILLIPFVGLSHWFMTAFTSDTEIINTGVMFLRIQAFAVPILGLQLTMMCTFQAMGKAVHALVINLGRQCLFYIPLLYILNNMFMLQGLMLAQPIADYMTTITALIIGVPLIRKLHTMNKQISEKTETVENPTLSADSAVS